MSKNGPHRRKRLTKHKKRGCTDKKRFPTQFIAMKVGAKLGLNWYWCHWCKGYHLTSQNTENANYKRSQ